MLLYFGIFSNPMHWSEIKEKGGLKYVCVLLNFILGLILLLLVKVSGRRGYAEEKEYQMGIRYCYECRSAKPERAHHCSRCRKCIKKMDHHCPWVGACINGENFGDFTKLLVISVLACAVGISLFSYIIRKKVPRTLSVMEMTPSFGIAIFNALSLLCVSLIFSTLLTRQTRLILKNMSYVEFLQVRKLEELGIQCPPNPYNRGAQSNLASTFGGVKDVFLCTAPAEAREQSYDSYWPPTGVEKGY